MFIQVGVKVWGIGILKWSYGIRKAEYQMNRQEKPFSLNCQSDDQEVKYMFEECPVH